ncbi:MAG: hypothetical protein V1831_02855 [Candidatus Woesearchaeota archaeon]
MPNLNDWIVAQLKKGYSKRQIKDSLIRRGYPSSSVASVDNIVSGHNVLGKSNSNRQKLTKKVTIFLGVLVLAVIIFVSLPGKVNEAPAELSGKEIISGRLFGINNNIFTILTQGGVVRIIINEVPEKGYIMKRQLLNGKLVEVTKDDILPGNKVIITTFVENGKTAVYSIVFLEEEDVANKGFKLIGGRLISVKGNTFKLLAPNGEVTEITHHGTEGNFSIMKQLLDKSTIKAGKEDLIWGTNVVLVTVIDNGETSVSSVVIQEKNNTPQIKKAIGKLIGLERNSLDIIDKDGKQITIRNSAPRDDIALMKILLNGTIVDAERTELKPGTNVAVSILNIYGQTVVRSITILSEAK